MKTRISNIGFAKEASLLVGLAIVFAAISNLTARPERRLDWIGKARVASPTPAVPIGPSKASADFPPHPDRPYLEIASEQARPLFDRKPLLLDALPTRVY